MNPVVIEIRMTSVLENFGTSQNFIQHVKGILGDTIFVCLENEFNSANRKFEFEFKKHFWQEACVVSCRKLWKLNYEMQQTLQNLEC